MNSVNIITNQLVYIIYLQQSLLYKMFQFQKDQLSYDLTINTFKNEFSNKLMVIEKYTYDFNQINTYRQSSNKATTELVKIIRKSIGEVEEIFQIAKVYLCELNLSFVNQLFYRSFQLLILGVKSISSKFVLSLNEKKMVQIPGNLSNEFVRKTQNQDSTRMSQLKIIQHANFIIKSLEDQDKKGDLEMKILQRQLKKQTNAAKINPSDTVNQLQSLNKEIQKIILNSYKICGQNVLSRHQEVSRKYLQLRKPEEIQYEFYNQFSQSMKDKFHKAIQKITKQLYYLIRLKQKEQIKQQILGQKPLVLQKSIQTETDGKIKQIQHLTKEKKAILTDLQNIKKSNILLQKQNQKMAQKIKQVKFHMKNIQRRGQDMEQQLNKKINQADFEKQQLRKQINKIKQQLSKKQLSPNPHSILNELSSNILFQKTKSQVERNQSNQILTEPISLKTSKYKHNYKEKAHILEKQLQIKTKQNVALHKILGAILNKLVQIKLIQYEQINLVEKQLDLAKLNKNIGIILNHLSQNINMVSKQNQNFSKDTKILDQGQIKRDFTSSQTQTQSIKQDDTKIYEHKQQNLEGNVNGKQNRLEQLKRQFIENIKRNKKTNGFFINRSKIKIKTLNQNPYYNKTLGNETSLEQINEVKQVNQNSQKYNKTLYKKDLSFQSFRITQFLRKSTIMSKSKNRKLDKIVTKDSKLQNIQQNHFSNQIIQLESYETLRQVYAIMQFIETKNDINNYFLNNFLKSLIKQMKKTKGKAVLQNLFQNQINEVVPKIDRKEPRINKPKYFNLQIPLLK